MSSKDQNRQKEVIASPRELFGDLPVEPICVRVSVAVKLSGISRSTLYELIDEGEIESVKIGRSIFIRYASLKRLFERE